MQAILGNETRFMDIVKTATKTGKPETVGEAIAQDAVLYADALIAELSKK